MSASLIVGGRASVIFVGCSYSPKGPIEKGQSSSVGWLKTGPDSGVKETNRSPDKKSKQKKKNTQCTATFDPFGEKLWVHVQYTECFGQVGRTPPFLPPLPRSSPNNTSASKCDFQGAQNALTSSNPVQVEGYKQIEA